MPERTDFNLARVGYLDDFGVPHTGIVVYQKPHRIEPDILYLGIYLEGEENEKVIVDQATGQQYKVGEYIRSDKVTLL